MHSLATQTPPPGDWHPADVVAALHRRGITITGLSTDHGYGRQALSKALRRPWPACERIIADALGMHPAEIWPSRYDAAGNSLTRPRGRR